MEKMNENKSETLRFTDMEISLPVKPWAKEYDVVVIGGGTAGAIAGIAAAREGESVLIVESGYGLGGSASRAQVTPMMSNYLPGSDNSSLDREIRRRMISNGWGDQDPWGQDGWFHPEMLKAVLEDMALEQGVQILYGAAYVNAVTEKNRITGILCETTEGLMLIRGRVFIDATGDAKVACTAGCPFESGDPVTGRNQKISLRFAIAQVNIQQLRDFLNQSGLTVPAEAKDVEIASLWSYGKEHPITSLFHQGVKEGILLPEDGAYFQAFSAPCYGGAIYLNCPEAIHVCNAVDSAAITQAVLDCRRAAVRLHRFLKKYIAGFSDSVIQSFAEMPGIRESRRITGRYVLTGTDYIRRRHFEDGIAQTAYPIDIHGGDSLECLPPMESGEYVEIPYSCMIPQNITNLLVTGRCISTTFTAQSAIRIQRVCRALGEAAGIAAAFACAGSDGDVTPVDGRKIRNRMIEVGGQFVS